MKRLLCRFAAVLLIAMGLVGITSVLSHPRPARAATINTGLTIRPVFSESVIGGFVQGGNTLFDCAGLTPFSVPGDDVTGFPIVAASSTCGRDINLALDGTYRSQNIPFYNDQVTQKFLNLAPNPGSNGIPGSFATTSSTSATVTVPAGAQVAFAELEWAGSTYGPPQNPNFVPNPNIYTEPMDVSIGDDTHFVSVTPDQGTQAFPGNPPVNTTAYYYSASANITSLMAGLTGNITVWGANTPWYAPGPGGTSDGFNRAGLGWHVVVVYEYPSIDPNATPPHILQQITVQTGLIYQQPAAPPGTPTDTQITVPPISDPNNMSFGVMGVEGDVAIQGDTLAINGHNIVHPFTGQPNNFFVSYAQGALDPPWTNNMSVDNVSGPLPSGIVAAGATSFTLTTNSQANATGQDTFRLTGMNTAVPVLAPHFTQAKTANNSAFVVGQTITYQVAVDNDGTAPGTATLTDTVPPTVAVSDVTCTPAGGATCTASHVGNVVSGTIGAPVGGSVAFTITGTVVSTGSATNTATITPTSCPALAECGGGDATTPPIVVPSISLALIKTADPTAVGAVNEMISYTFTVKNTGDVTVETVVITDVPRAPAGPPGAVTCDQTTLAPGASTLCHSTYAASAADITEGQIFNTATAAGTAVVGGNTVPAVSNPFSASVDVRVPQPGFTSIVVNTTNTLTLEP